MSSVVFSSSLVLPEGADVELVQTNILEIIQRLRCASKGPLYLCGGGELAGWLVKRSAIDLLRLKRAPILLGGGTRLFGSYEGEINARLVETNSYDAGIVYQEYELAGGAD